MLACSCRSFLRWPLTNYQHLQRCFSSCGFEYNLGTHIEGVFHVAMDRKKQKMIAKTWRPVSTQSRSSEVLGDEKHNLGGQVQEVKCTVSSYESTVLAEDSGAEVVNDDEPLSAAQKHSVKFEAGASLMRFIRGKGGATQRTIEKETGVKIILPLSRKEDCLIIEGNSAESVGRASDRVQAIIDEAVKSRNLDYSHFVSLPLAIYPELVNKLINFQNSILGTTEVNQDENLECDSSGNTSDSEGEEHYSSKPRVAVEVKTKDSNDHVKVDITNMPLVSYSPKVSKSSPSESKASKVLDLGIEKSIFIKPKTFHLTVLMLKLWNKDRINAASEVLRNVSPKVIDALESQPVSIRLRGLECMRGSPAKARVVYAPVEVIGGEDRLLRACLPDKPFMPLLLQLHATIMNARHRKSKTRSRKADSFDARTIFGQYGSEQWGEYLIREAHLSQRFVFDDNGYYHCCASIPFPEEMQLD
uniref:Uncharacterized protein LOC104234651 isoform X3 n=1 Tax=Nicotiana sylvestris TaxID=4096 RepID=A0A1U7XHY3_NICSY|nr:PREDICTED: uncharacterized protein LOC104234651 isoform X3 [Nicotiana sylvestris]